MVRSKTDEILEGWQFVLRHATPSQQPPRAKAGRWGPLPGGLATALALLIIAALGLVVYLSAPKFAGSMVGGGLVGTASPSNSDAVAAAPTPSAPAAPPSSLSPQPRATLPAVATPLPGDSATAATLVRSYLTHLIDTDWAAAYALLAPEQRTTLADFAHERAVFLGSVRGRFVEVPPTHDADVLTNWLTAPGLTTTADRSRAFIVEVDYPAVSPNTNANFDIFLAAPDASGHWYVWDVR